MEEHFKWVERVAFEYAEELLEDVVKKAKLRNPKLEDADFEREQMLAVLRGECRDCHHYLDLSNGNVYFDNDCMQEWLSREPARYMLIE